VNNGLRDLIRHRDNLGRKIRDDRQNSKAKKESRAPPGLKRTIRATKKGKKIYPRKGEKGTVARETVLSGLGGGYAERSPGMARAQEGETVTISSKAQRNHLKTNSNMETAK